MLRVAMLVLAIALVPAPAMAQARRVAVLDFANTAKDASVEGLGPAVAAERPGMAEASRMRQEHDRLRSSVR